jgi:hypothetical protein
VKYGTVIHDTGRGPMPPRPYFDWAMELGAMKKIETRLNSDLAKLLNV